MNQKGKYISKIVLASAALLAAFAAADAKADDWNSGSYRAYQPGYGYYNAYRTNWSRWNRWGNNGNYWGYNSNVFYYNGYYYYKAANGDYYIYRNRRWELYYTNGYNNLRNDPHYRYENGYHYYVLDDGSYYYYENGQWIYVKKQVDPDPSPDPQPNPDPTPDPQPNPDPTPDPQPNPDPTPDPNPNPDPTPDPKPDPNPDPEPPKPDPDKPEDLDWAPDPNIDYDKLPKPLYKPTDPRMQRDPHFVYSNGTYYYIVNIENDNPRGIDGYYKWEDNKWKLYNGTASDDPALDPNNHTDGKDEEYRYDDDASNVKLYSTNVVGKGQAGQALPFKTKEEFQAYVEKELKPVYKDNAGYDCKVTYELVDEDGFNNSKDAAWARDYVLRANITSSVKGYEKTEFGHIDYVFHVEGDESSTYPEIDMAKQAFAAINAKRKAANLPELTWSDEIYNSQSLPGATKIALQWDSDAGINYRRESDPAKVAEKWLSSGQADFLLSPDAKEGAVACVLAGDGTYYWMFNYK